MIIATYLRSCRRKKECWKY